MEYNPEAVSAEIEEGLKKIIDEYVNGIRDIIYDSYSVKDSVTMYFGRGKAQRSPLHKELYEDMEKEVASVKERLEAAPDEDGAYRAVDTILNYAREDFSGLEDNMRLAFIAVEALAIPLLEYVNADRIRELKEAYLAKYPVRMMLPKQKELYDEMRRCCGEEVKNKWKPSDIFNDTHFFERHNIKVPNVLKQKRK